MNPALELATLGGGCFWCIEAALQAFAGVEKVESGYAGGQVDSPTYEAVSNGESGHAEVVQVTFNPSVISFQELLTIFFHAHDPTTLNRQGNDVGTQYRSVIFTHNGSQAEVARKVTAEITNEGLWADPIVTEIAPLSRFYKAEEYHQNYYKNNKDKPYCSIVIAPKLQKLFKQFKSKLKDQG